MKPGTKLICFYHDNTRAFAGLFQNFLPGGFVQVWNAEEVDEKKKFVAWPAEAVEFPVPLQVSEIPNELKPHRVTDYGQYQANRK